MTATGADLLLSEGWEPANVATVVAALEALAPHVGHRAKITKGASATTFGIVTVDPAAVIVRYKSGSNIYTASGLGILRLFGGATITRGR